MLNKRSVIITTVLTTLAALIIGVTGVIVLTGNGASADAYSDCVDANTPRLSLSEAQNVCEHLKSGNTGSNTTAATTDTSSDDSGLSGDDGINTTASCQTTGEAKSTLGIDVQRLALEDCAWVWRGVPNTTTAICPSGWVCTLHLSNDDINVFVGDGKQYTIQAGTFRMVAAYRSGDAVHESPPCELLKKEKNFGHVEDPSFPVEGGNFSCGGNVATAQVAPASGSSSGSTSRRSGSSGTRRTQATSPPATAAPAPATTAKPACPMGEPIADGGCKVMSWPANTSVPNGWWANTEKGRVDSGGSVPEGAQATLYQNGT